MKEPSPEPTICFRVHPEGKTSISRRGERPCVIGKEIRFNPAALEYFCFKSIDDIDYELIFLAGVCAYADRAVVRHRGTGWSRSLKIVMPVRNPEIWGRFEIISALKSTLQYLTGDKWEFDFVSHNKPWGSPQKILALGEGHFIVIPFSDGLDSFAQSQLLKIEKPRPSPILVTKWSRGLVGDRDWQVDGDGTKIRRVSMPVDVKCDSHAEPTYRTRSFLFCALAAVAAKLSDSKAVLIPENGQGSLGASLVPFGNESPPRGSHPGFTQKLSNFLFRLWGKRIIFEHRQLWKTKGAVLKELSVHKYNGHSLLSGWESKRSCSLDSRYASADGHKISCGICAGCLLRRFAAFSANLDDPTQYLWADLRRESLKESLSPKASRPYSKAYWDIAIHAVLPLNELAILADAPENDLRLYRAAVEIANGNLAEAKSYVPGIRALLREHKREWLAFTVKLGPRSWINKIISHA